MEIILKFPYQKNLNFFIEKLVISVTADFVLIILMNCRGKLQIFFIPGPS